MSVPAPRYAIYYLPDENSRLAQFGARWFGYDCHSGRTCDRASFGLGALAAQAVETPAKYGFHATLVAPFHLLPSVAIEDVIGRMRAVAASVRPPEPARLSMRELGRFVALRPDDDLPLRQLSVSCLVACNPLRASLSNAERERRLRSPFSEYQRILLETYGYPYVMDEFRFHMTLTGRLSDEERVRIQSALAGELAPILAEPVKIHALSLLEQATPDVPFRFYSRVELAA